MKFHNKKEKGMEHSYTKSKQKKHKVQIKNKNRERERELQQSMKEHSKSGVKLGFGSRVF